MEMFLGLASILMVVLLGAVSPGPSFLLVARVSISQSRRNGIFAAVGMGVGGAAFAMLALLGLKAVFVSFPWFYIVLKVIGGTYLVYIGVQIWRGASEPMIMDPVPSQGRRTGWHSYITALFTQLSNPKPAVFYGSIFAALLPQAISWQFSLLLLILVFMVETVWYCVVALLLSSTSPRAAYLRSKIWIDRVAGGIMGLLGVKLITSTDTVV